jgi:hypothetical protein
LAGALAVLAAALLPSLAACGPDSTDEAGSGARESAIGTTAAPTESAAPAESSGEEAVTRDGCLRVNAVGDLVFEGEIAPGLQELADRLNAAAAAAPGQYAGTAFCGRYEGVVVFVKDDSEDTAEQVAKIAGEHAEFAVTVRPVGASLAELEAASLAVMAIPEYEGVITGSGPDARIGGLVVDVMAEGSSPDPEELVDAGALAAKVGLPVRLRVAGQGQLLPYVE